MSPLKWIICPDGTHIEVISCLAGCNHECLTLPTRHMITSEREWNGNPSTTQLLNGTMLEFLKITKDYAINPQDRAFMLSGTRHHQELEAKARELGLPTEIALSPDGRDVFDLIEPVEGGWKLTDYKLWGSYRIGRAIGMVSKGKSPDPSGAKYIKSGKWGAAGSPKMKEAFGIDTNTIDLQETELQLNHYRIMLEERGLNIVGMRIQATVRDGGLAVARDRGIDFNIMLIPVKHLDNGYVTQYFNTKKQQLLCALNEYTNDRNYLPMPCDTRESWEGRRCNGFCDVAQFCPKGMLAGG